MPTPRVIRLPVIPTVVNNGSALSGLRSAVAPALNVPATEKFQCNVCQENCTAGDLYVVPACLHSYCGDCISECIRMFGNECPACLVNSTNKQRDLVRQDKKIDNVSTSTHAIANGCHHVQ